MFQCRDALSAAVWLLISTAGLLGQAVQSGPQLYFFTMDGCPPCAQVRPEIERLAAAGYPVTTIDARTNPEWSRHFSVQSTPTVILLSGEEVIHRESGLVNATQIVGWFQALAARTRTPQRDTRTSPGKPDAASNAMAFNATDSNQGSRAASSPLKGSRSPASAGEAIAMRATVRLRVEDSEGFSFATGTIIHAHGPEAVVLTCGHVFRDNQGVGRISADIGWMPGETPQTVPGQLLHYDAGPADVALILIQAGEQLPVAELARPESQLARGLDIFSVGCDEGQPPTIRQTQLKDHSNYDGVDKYDIVGRPAIGRSGGGLFTSDGRLIGVCNAAAVDFDEGIYTSLPNIWRELAMTRMDQVLVTKLAVNRELNAEAAGEVQLASHERDLASARSADRNAMPDEIAFPNPVSMTTVSQSVSTGGSDHELVVVMRNRKTGDHQSWVIDQPTGDLLERLEQESRNTNSGEAHSPTAPRNAADGFAALRRSMPVPPASPAAAGQPVLRAQSADGAAAEFIRR